MGTIATLEHPNKFSLNFSKYLKKLISANSL